MTRLFKWDDKYSVEVPSLDDQHKNFFDITNRILVLLEKPHNPELKESVVMLLIELGNYASNHLDYEEGCIRKNFCTGCEDHPVAHSVYRDKIREYLRRVREADTDIYALAFEVAEFTQYWLSQHILAKDRCYISCLTQHKVK